MDSNISMVKQVAHLVKIALILFATGLIIGALAGLAGALIPGVRPESFGPVSGASAGVIIGYPLGAIIGLILITKVFYRRGSLLLGISGILIGMAITIVLWYKIQDDKDVYYLIASFILAPVILGVLGYYLREVKAETKKG